MENEMRTLSKWKLELFNKVMNTAEQIAKTITDHSDKELHIQYIKWERNPRADLIVSGVFQYASHTEDEQWQNVELTFDKDGMYLGLETKGERY